MELNLLQGADFSGQNLTKASFYAAQLNGADLSNANLTQANLVGADLTDANLTGAAINGADFSLAYYNNGSGISLAKLYSTVSYQVHDLSGIHFDYNNLANANLAGQNLNGASLQYAVLTDANFTGASIQGANLAAAGSGLTLAQLYTTASYQDHNLVSTVFDNNAFSGADFNNQNLNHASFSSAQLDGASFSHANLCGANFQYAVLTGADFSGAQIQGANLAATYVLGNGITLAQLYSTASYQTRNLANIVFDNNLFSGADFSNQNLNHASFSSAQLDGASFSHANLRGANFQYAVLTGADFSGAQIQGANLAATYVLGNGITLAQLYSTASYQLHDLSGVVLDSNDLSGANLANQNLHGASLQGTLFANADLHNAVLTNATFTSYYTDRFTGANLSGADTRGAQNLDTSGAIVTNMILPDGHTNGLNLGPNQTLVIHNYHSDPTQNLGPLPIYVTQSLSVTSGGTLRLQLDADPWGSVIEFDKNISVDLGGTLDLEFADCVDPKSQLDRTFDLFDWTGVTPNGQFTINSPYQWDLSHLYTTGEVTLVAVPEPAGLYLAMVGFVAISFRTSRRSRSRRDPLRAQDEPTLVTSRLSICQAIPSHANKAARVRHEPGSKYVRLMAHPAGEILARTPLPENG